MRSANPWERSAVARLIADSRVAKRPRWSQQFLADELTRRGVPASRSGIARLESSRPHRNDMELFVAACVVLGVPLEAVVAACSADVLLTMGAVAETLQSAASEGPTLAAYQEGLATLAETALERLRSAGASRQ